MNAVAKQLSLCVVTLCLLSIIHRAGAVETGQHARGKLLYEGSMGTRDTVKGWKMEGPGTVDFRDGWMQMFSPQEKMHHVYWCPATFPSAFVAEWDAQNLKTEAGLCIVFFAARGDNGKDIFDPTLPARNGTFKQYTHGRIVSYHISYYTNAAHNPDRGHTNLRKNNKFILLQKGKEGIPARSKKIHKIRLVKDGPHIVMYVDKRKVIDWTDDGKRHGPAHTSGRIGFRQMKWTRFRYRNFRVWELRSGRTDNASGKGAGKPAASGSPRAVPTFESIGIYWKAGPGAPGGNCAVRYRAKGTEVWREALPLWYDKRNGEYRGSILNLKPGTDYEIGLRPVWHKAWIPIRAKTWSESFQIERTVYLEPGTRSEPLVIKEGGKPGAYVLYTVRPGKSTTIDVANKHACCVEVNAPRVIVRGLALKGAREDGIKLGKVKDVVIERCDISGWGRKDPCGFGFWFDSGIKAEWSGLKRIVIQRNRIHHPRYDSNNWTEKGFYARQPYHPFGPQAISWMNNRGNHVIRYNEFYSDDAHRFTDVIGWGSDRSEKGFPGPDSDVCGNLVTSCWDDGLQIEGGGCNVRVWGNYIDKTMVGIATASCTVGPLYIFRNVFARSQLADFPGGDTDALVLPGHFKPRGLPPTHNRGYFAKVGETPKVGSGRQYWLHNTMLQPAPPPGGKLTLGAQGGLNRVGKTMMITQLVSLNNIWHVCHTPGKGLVDRLSLFPGTNSRTNTFDYDLYNGTIKEAYKGAEANGIRAVPVYLKGHGAVAGSKGLYQLKPGSPGHDAGKRIPNVNDGFQGKAPDIGACETGGEPMQFGVDAYLKKKSSGDRR